jgi:hypothetical protein
MTRLSAATIPACIRRVSDSLNNLQFQEPNTTTPAARTAPPKIHTVTRDTFIHSYLGETT